MFDEGSATEGAPTDSLTTESLTPERFATETLDRGGSRWWIAVVVIGLVALTAFVLLGQGETRIPVMYTL